MLRIPIRVRYRGKELVLEALLNTGLESDVPVISVPLHVAEELGIELSEVREYSAVGRFRGFVLVSNEPVEVIVSRGDRSSTAQAYVIVVPGEDEVLISYLLARELRLCVDFSRENWWIS